MKTIRFTSTKLKYLNKKGLITPDADGYREIILGGLNVFNSAGEYYTLKYAEDLFKDSSILMRRVAKGMVKAELGHPVPPANSTEAQYLNRMVIIDEKNVSAHIKSIWLDYDFGRKNPQFKNPSLVAIMGEVCPSGPYGPALEASFRNPNENVAFSIRGLTENYYERGQCYRVLTAIIGFDQVAEQGIPIANMWDSPALESLTDYKVSERNLRQALENRSVFATENTKEISIEILRNLDNRVQSTKGPIFTRW